MFEREPDLLSIKQAGLLIHLGRTSMLALIHSGELEALRVKNKWLIPKEELAEYLRHK